MSLNTVFEQHNIDLSSLVYDLPGYLLIKDLDSMYLGGNANVVQENGFKDSDDLYGFTDTTIPHPISEFGRFFMDLDSDLLQSQKNVQGLYAFPFHGRMHPFQFNRFILKNRDGQNIGIYSHAFQCQDKKLYQLVNHLSAIDPPHYWQEKNVYANCYLINESYDGAHLSALESCCLFFLLRNKTSAEIANIIRISTMESSQLIDNIFQKLMIKSKAELIDFSIQKNWFRIVPPGIVTQLTSGHHNLDEKSVYNARALSTTEQCTKREIDCANLLMKGMKIKEIALALNLSPRTVETHINNLKIKLNCRDKSGIIIKLNEMNSN